MLNLLLACLNKIKHPNIFRNFAPVLVRGGLKKCRNESERLAENRFTNIIMYAIVEINGQQFKVEQGMKLYVHHIKDVEAGKTVEFDKVLLVDKEGAVTVGAPTVEGAKVVVEVVNPLVKGDKVIVFKMKRRKDYRKKNGHRAQFTQVEVKQVIA